MNAPGLSMFAFWETKDGSIRADWEDGVAYSPSSGRFAVSDGASTGQRSREWAYTLVSTFLAAGFDFGDRPSEVKQQFMDWIDHTRSGFEPLGPEFSASKTPQWVQDHAAERGAYATFIGGEVQGDRLRLLSLGDCCAFVHQPDGGIVTFPLNSANDFGSAPELVSSKPGGSHEFADLELCELPVTNQDLLVVASDALAEWLIGQIDDNELWAMLRTIGPEGFRRLLSDLRSRRLIKNDDVTMLRGMWGV